MKTVMWWLSVRPYDWEEFNRELELKSDIKKKKLGEVRSTIISIHPY